MFIYNSGSFLSCGSCAELMKLSVVLLNAVVDVSVCLQFTEPSVRDSIERFKRG